MKKYNVADVNELTLLQNFQMLLHCADADSGFGGDVFQTRPAEILTSGAAYEVRVQRELDWCQSQVEDAVGQTIEFFGGRLILSHHATSVFSSIHWMNLSLGTRIRLPIFIRGNPSLRTNSYVAALEIPRTSPTSGAVKVRGRS